MFSLYCVCLFPTALRESKVCRADTYVIYPKHSNFMSIIIKDLSYTHTDKEVLFSNLNLIINSGEKTALTGNNGCGKSTLREKHRREPAVYIVPGIFTMCPSISDNMTAGRLHRY